MSVKTVKNYSISANLVLTVDLTIKASSFSDALEQAQALGVKDFVEAKGDITTWKPVEIHMIYKEE